jgi:hypothetical protein
VHYLNSGLCDYVMSEGAIPLTAVQIVTIHGWFTPKRMLSWKDICVDDNITTKLCSSCGIDDELLYVIQPSLQKWIEVRGVTFKDVIYMTKWPLHPFRDLNGYISDLIENHYEAPLLHKLGINYQVLMERNMTIDWMKMFNYTVKEWTLLGFGVHDASL